MRQPLPAGPWLPDRPALANPGLPALMNLVPLTPASYGPVRALSPALVASAGPLQPLDSTVLGGGAFVSTTDNTFYLMAATTAHFYWWSPGQLQWTECDGVGETYSQYYSGSGLQGFDPTYRFAAFDNEIIITRGTVENTVPSPASLYPFEIHTFNITSTTVPHQTGPTSTAIAPLLNDAEDSTQNWTGQTIGQSRGYYPSWSFIIKGFLVIGGLRGARNRLAWSGQNDPQMWPTPGSNLAEEQQSDYEDLPGAFGNIQLGVGNLMYCDAVILCDDGIWRMTYVGPSDIFDFYPALSGKGTQHPNSVVQVGGTIYYFSRDGFYSFDGINCNPISAQKVSEWFLGTANLYPPYLLRGVFDIASKCIVWTFTNGASSTVPNMMLIYQVDLGQWSAATFAGEFIFQNVNRPQQLYFQDIVPPTNATFDAWLFDLSHRLSFMSGPTLQASMTTREIEAAQQTGGKVWLRGATPLIDGWSGVTDDGDTTADPTTDPATPNTITVTMATRQRLVDPVVAGPAVPLNRRGVCPQRGGARYLRATMTIPAGSTWSVAMGVELDMQPAGLR